MTLHSSAFPWLSTLTDEEVYEFLDQVIRAAVSPVPREGTEEARPPLRSGLFALSY
jgi:hypothetical protein